MRAFIRWLAADEIKAARIQGYREGMASVSASIRRTAAKDPAYGEGAKKAVLAIAGGIDDALAETRDPTP